MLKAFADSNTAICGTVTHALFLFSWYSSYSILHQFSSDVL